MGLSAALPEAPMLLRYEASSEGLCGEYRRNSLSVSVYAACTFPQGRLSDFGPTFATIRSPSSKRAGHCPLNINPFMDVLHVVRQKELAEVAVTPLGHVKPIMVLSMNTEPGEHLYSNKMMAAAVCVFKKCDLDALFVVSHAGGPSEGQCSNRRMAALAKDVSGEACDFARFPS